MSAVSPSLSVYSASRAKHWLLKFFALQLLALLFLSCLWLWFHGRSAGLSSVLGGVIVIVPNTLFALLLFRRLLNNSDVSQLLWSLYAGELLKLVVLVVLAYASLRFFVVRPLPLFCSMGVGYFLFWLAPLHLKKASMGYS